MPSETVFHAWVESRATDACMNQLVEKANIQSHRVSSLHALYQSLDQSIESMEKSIPVMNSVKVGRVPREL
jgi:hypothetical protein